MASPTPIVCRPTPWFLCRAGIIFLMFAVFAVLFYIDGSTGYRKKNKAFVLHQAFTAAKEAYSEKAESIGDDPEAWREYAASQTLHIPEADQILPNDMELPVRWPDVLHDIEVAKALQKGNQPWQDFSAQAKLAAKPPEKLYTASKIREQWLVFYICITLSTLTLFFLIRTSRRSITATEDSLITQDGRKIPYSDIHRLDLRKWDNKGIAIAEYEGSSGKGRVRIDGLTYGGFKKDLDQPAERLMELLRSNFSGELIEYTSVIDDEDPDDQIEPESKP